MPCAVTEGEKNWWRDQEKEREQKSRGINTDSSREDYLASLLCTHLRFLANQLNYKDFTKLVQPEILKWFDEHCKNEGGL